MTYVIEKNGLQPEFVQPAQEQVQVFTVKYFKTAVDVEGNKVEVVDDNRIENVTIKQLEAQKVSYQNMIKEIDNKLLEITKLV